MDRRRSRHFNPRSRTGSDIVLLDSRSGEYLLQSTLPHGERRYLDQTKAARTLLQSTLPHGERLPGVNLPPIVGILQSTLPHGERRTIIAQDSAHLATSIHAPARGATIMSCRKYQPSDYFNPRSRTGSDTYHPHLFLYVSNFNPRSRTGSDLHHRRCSRPCTHFNPRSRTGSDAVPQLAPSPC